MKEPSKQSMRAFERWLEAHAEEAASPEDVERLVDAYISAHPQEATEPGGEARQPACASDWLRRAEQARDPAAARRAIECALALEPENLDALRLRAERQGQDDDETRVLLETAMDIGRRAAARAGWDASGKAGLAPGARPYMRLRRRYIDALADCGMIRPAIAEALETLRLDEADSAGVRFRLMHLYARLGELEEMRALHARCEGYDETPMLLPLAAGAYAAGQLAAAGAYLLRLQRVNPYTGAFLREAGEDGPERLPRPALARPFTKEELRGVVADNRFLYGQMKAFFRWGGRLLAGSEKPQNGD